MNKTKGGFRDAAVFEHDVGISFGPEQIGNGSGGVLCLNPADSPKWKLAKLHYLSQVFIP